jgi:hypothetical protein
MLLAVFAVTGGSPLVNEITIALTFILMVEMQIAILTITHRNAPLSLLFVTLVFLYFGAPIIGYLLYPDEFLLLHSVEDVNRALLYLVMGSATAIWGIKWGSRRFTSSTRKDPNRPFYSSPRVFFIVTMAYIGIGIWIVLTYRKATTLIDYVRGGPFSFLTRFVDVTILLIIGLVLAIEHWPKFSKSGRMLLFISITMVVLMNGIFGARSTIYVVVLFVLMLLFIKKGNFRVGRSAIILTILAILASMLAFSIITNVREYWKMGATLEHYPSIEEFIQAAKGGETGSTDQFKDLIYPVLYRLNGLDSLVIVTSCNREDASLYINLVNEFKSFVNIITPGDPFPGIRETSKMFLVAYKDVPIEYLDSYYVTSMYTLWGIFYADFGYIGGLLATGAFMFFVAGVYQWLSRLKTCFNIYWRLWWLIFADSVILSFGLDRIFAQAIYRLIPGVLLLAILAYLSPSRKIDLNGPKGRVPRACLG